MKLYSQKDNYTLYQGSMLDMLEVIKPSSIDAIVTDQPYELNFMNKGWDNSGIAFQKDTWSKCFEVLKTGGYLLAFGGSRTFHRIACAIEDAGFEIRDVIMWLYGSGFPKSLNIGLAIDKKNGVESEVIGVKPYTDNANIMNVSNYNGERIQGNYLKAMNKWDGWGTALKPAYEPIIVARKPVENSVTDNVLKYGVGGINIDECRVGNEVIKGGTMPKMNAQSDGINLYNFGKKNAERLDREDNIGRFPSNVILTYDDSDYEEVCGGMPNTTSRTALISHPDIRHSRYMQSNGCLEEKELCGYEDSGSASRYFYCAKASVKDRDEGLDEFEIQIINDGSVRQNRETANKFGGEPVPKRNIHPTVKPVELMQYLVRLVAPKGATILDCFNGSGSTGKAVMYENGERDAGYKYIGIDLDEEYLKISEARIQYAQEKSMQTKLF